MRKIVLIILLVLVGCSSSNEVDNPTYEEVVELYATQQEVSNDISVEISRVEYKGIEYTEGVTTINQEININNISDRALDISVVWYYNPAAISNNYAKYTGDEADTFEIAAGKGIDSGISTSFIAYDFSGDFEEYLHSVVPEYILVTVDGERYVYTSNEYDCTFMDNIEYDFEVSVLGNEYTFVADIDGNLVYIDIDKDITDITFTELLKEDTTSFYISESELNRVKIKVGDVYFDIQNAMDLIPDIIDDLKLVPLVGIKETTVEQILYDQKLWNKIKELDTYEIYYEEYIDDNEEEDLVQFELDGITYEYDQNISKHILIKEGVELLELDNHTNRNIIISKLESKWLPVFIISNS